MSNDGKKITFSFSKVKKPALINKVNLEPKEKIDYVDCFDGSKGKFSFKGHVKNDGEEKRELVIPMPVSRTATDVVKSRIEEKANRNLLSNGSIKAEDDKSEIKKECPPENLDHLAAQEILNEIKNGDVDKKQNDKLVIESADVPQLPSETDIDYDNIPVTDFGLAMLRGMGWRPDLGIGKDPRLVEAAAPKLRPKGLGLGAQPIPEPKDDEKLEEKEKSRHKDDKKLDVKEKSRYKDDKKLDTKEKSRHKDDRKLDTREKSWHSSSDSHKKKSHRH